MRIISRKDPSLWRGDATCSDCLSIIEVAPGDLANDWLEPRYARFVCPVCGAPVGVLIANIPFAARKFIRPAAASVAAAAEMGTKLLRIVDGNDNGDP